MSRSDSDTAPDGGASSTSVPGMDYDFGEKSAADIARDFYQIPALLAVVAVMLWIRLQSYERFVRDGQVYFSGNDAWYHLRQVRYTVSHWPWTMPFDPWTHYPFGTSVGQFGTLYDQLVATAALIVGLGSPSSTLVAKTLLVAPAVFGALVAVPTYLIGKRLGGRLGGLFGAVILMLFPGTFLRRGLVGFADHNIAEPFFQGFAVVALMVALAVAQRDRPIWELVQAREWDVLKPTLVWSAVAGVAVGLYIWTWPPGVLLLGIFAAYVAYQSVSDYRGGRSPDHVAFVAVVSMVVTAVMAMLRFQEATFNPVDFGLLQPLFALGVAAGAVGLAALARAFDARDLDGALDAYGYAGTVGLLAAVGVVLVIAVDASPFTTLENNLLRFVGFSAGAQTRTIGEAQPFLTSGFSQYYGGFGVVIAEYGFAFVTALAAAVWLLAKPLWRRGRTGDYAYLGASALVVLFVFVGSSVYNGLMDGLGFNPQVAGLGLVALLVFGAVARVRYDAEHLFVFVWAAFITAAAFTQVRFNYYLAVSVAALNAYFLREVLVAVGVDLSSLRGVGRSADGSSGGWLPDVETYQVIAVALAVLVVLGPVLVVPLTLGNTGNVGIDRTNTAVGVGDSAGPGAVTIWDDELEWLQDHSPAEGNLEGAGEQGKLDYYGTYERPDDGDFDYPPGTYGVMSWWDYGHWITTQAERIPHANPFQEGASSAARFLLAPGEQAAAQVLDNIDPNSDEAHRMRYVMVDWQMVTIGSKFGAPIVFNDDVSAGEFYSPALQEQQTGQGTQYGVAFYDKKQRYYESLMVQLYKFHGSRAEPTVSTMFGERTVVFDYDTVSAPDGTTYKVVPTGQNETAVRTFPNESAARQYVEAEGSAQIGGIGAYPREPVPALQHYRLVSVSDTSAYASGQYQQTALREARALGLRPNLLQQTQPQWVKTFEKVPGAQVEGTGADPNETVTVRVQMRVPEGGTGNNASTFTYTQQTTANEEGNFEFVLPYATTGYDKYGPEQGYTNVSVRAAGPYTVTGEVTENESGHLLRDQTTFDVSEGNVNGANNSTIQIQLTEEVVREPQSQNGTANGTTNGTANGTATNGTADGTNTSGTNESNGSNSLGADLDALNSLGGPAASGAHPAGATGEPFGSAPSVRAPTAHAVAP